MGEKRCQMSWVFMDSLGVRGSIKIPSRFRMQAWRSLWEWPHSCQGRQCVLQSHQTQKFLQRTTLPTGIESKTGFW